MCHYYLTIVITLHIRLYRLNQWTSSPAGVSVAHLSVLYVFAWPRCEDGGLQTSRSTAQMRRDTVLPLWFPKGGKASTNCACLMSRSVCTLRTHATNTQISSKVIHVESPSSLPNQTFIFICSRPEFILCVSAHTCTTRQHNIFTLGSLCLTVLYSAVCFWLCCTASMICMEI